MLLLLQESQQGSSSRAHGFTHHDAGGAGCGRGVGGGVDSGGSCDGDGGGTR